MGTSAPTSTPSSASSKPSLLLPPSRFLRRQTSYCRWRIWPIPNNVLQNGTATPRSTFIAPSRIACRDHNICLHRPDGLRWHRHAQKLTTAAGASDSRPRSPRVRLSYFEQFSNASPPALVHTFTPGYAGPAPEPRSFVVISDTYSSSPFLPAAVVHSWLRLIHLRQFPAFTIVGISPPWFHWRRFPALLPTLSISPVHEKLRSNHDSRLNDDGNPTRFSFLRRPEGPASP